MEVYLDNSATTKPYEEVVEAVAYTMNNYYGNPSSIHKLGMESEKKLNECRNIIGKTINCTRDEIIFTSGGSESNNLFIKGFVKPGGNAITTRIEHPSVLNTFKDMEKEGVKVTYLDVDCKGRISLEQLENSIDKDTQLISIMHVNNEIGTIQDIESIGNIIKKKSSRAKFHVDAVQSYGKLNIDVMKSKIDLLSASAHKIHGPRGAGFAYIKKGLIPKPLIIGGGQEKAFRSGTENLPAIVGFAKAAEMINKNRNENFEKVRQLKSYFIDRLKDIQGIRINSPLEEGFIPYILNVSFIAVRSEVLLHLLEEKDIYVSMGSACSSKDTKDSHVLKAIGLKDVELKGTIRFSFSELNTTQEIDYTIENLEKDLKFLRRVAK